MSTFPKPMPASRADDVFHLVRPDGTRAAIRLAGQPVSQFAPGWRPRGGALGFAPWVLLDLEHEDGSEATWFLDETLEHRSSALRELPQAATDEIADAVSAILRAVHRDLLCGRQPRRPESLDRFSGINGAMIDILLDAALHRSPMPTSVVTLAEAEASPDSVTVALRKGTRLRLRTLASCLGARIQDVFEEAMRTGSLVWPSPVDGRTLSSCCSLVIDEHRNAYRFVDTRHGLVFYVGTTNDLFQASDVFIPAADLVICQDAGSAASSRDLGRLFLRHVLREADRLPDYMAQPQHRLATACRGIVHMHIGHHVWNELTGLDRLVRRLRPEHLPMVVVPDTEVGSEPFAPIDQIFPELSGRIDRGLRSPRGLAHHIYSQGYCLTRALDEYVTTGLSARIRRAALRDPPTRYDEALAARLEACGTSCIVLGIRVENRTAADLEATLASIIEHLRQRLGSVAIFLDGHNARLGHDPVSSFGSFGQREEHEHPIFAELRLAQMLHRRFARAPVEIVSLFGAALSRSLFWTQRCRFFVAFWGAGLAKYRWACNRPGLVLTSHWNLAHRGDLGIYHEPRYQEAPAPVVFIDASAVTDLPEAPVLFSPINPVPSYSNFRVSPEALRSALDVMVGEHVPGPNPGHPKGRASAP